MSTPRRLTLPLATPSPGDPGCAPADPHADEFARGANAWPAHFSRRDFLTRAGASLALAGVVGCSDHPDEPIVPYVDPPEQVVVGEQQFFATTLTRNGYGRGVIVTSREGRPVKIEGNPDHPSSLGAADAQMQAAVLDLYDPRRSKSVTQAGEGSTWGAFVSALRTQIDSHAADGGSGLAVLTGNITSPTVGRLMNELRQKLPNVTWHAYEPTGRDEPITQVYDFAGADVIVSFGNDFLADAPGSLAYARQFADRRRVTADRPKMSRLYVAECDRSITGTKADHRLAVRPSRLMTLATALATQLGVTGAAMPSDLSPAEAAWLSAAATDLAAARGRGVVLVGDAIRWPETFAYSINESLGNAGKTVKLRPSPLRSPIDRGHAIALASLALALTGGEVRTLLIAADNPARHAPGDVAFGDALEHFGRNGGFAAHLGPYANETAYACRWHVPAQHDLERWGDVAAHDGTPSFVQPLIAPLNGGHDVIDLLNAALGREHSAYDTVRETWRNGQSDPPTDNTPISDGLVVFKPPLKGPVVPAGQFETWWTDALRRGVAGMPFDAPPGYPIGVGQYAWMKPTLLASALGIDVVLRPDPSIGDGAMFHNPWLQELPRPLSKIVWGNAALISPATALRYGVADEDVVRLEKDGRSVETPVLVMPGVADDTAVLHLGYGVHRITGGDAALAESNRAYGVDAYPLRSMVSPGVAMSASLTPMGRKQKIVRTHNHHAMNADGAADTPANRTLMPKVVATPATPRADLELHNRKLIRTATVAQLAAAPDFAAKMDGQTIEQLYPSWNYDTGPQWGMTIDLSSCIGCNACITACQAENNTPTVGPDQVDKQREMHWLRVDSYQDDAGRVHHQPVPCMHCENAPCEYVCPVAATTHSVEGLNQMTYNRCVGTRYCSNNCPYKVRRFNFLNYTAGRPQSYNMQANPDVTVRTRGVMEKCTYCVQRINYATRKTEIAAVNAGGDTTKLRRDTIGRLQTACQQTCPTNAIVFGDLTDPTSAVAASKKDGRNYGLLVELTTKPRTTYLASITNPNPTSEGGA